jgi:phosphoglycolate phosphatase-like HAD superfamily hydrolase
VAAWLPGVLVALIGIVPGVLVWRQAAQAKQETAAAQRYAQGLDARKVDQLAYESARSIYEAGLAEAQRQLAQRLEQILILERDVARLQRRLDAHELALRQAGVPPPAEEP